MLTPVLWLEQHDFKGSAENEAVAIQTRALKTKLDSRRPILYSSNSGWLRNELILEKMER